MKILLTTLNSKYVHSNLALKYLYTVTAGEYSDLDVREFTINNDPNYIYTELVRANYDMICFSCYLWNIEQIKPLAADLKKACPELVIVLGGPEVSFTGPEFMQANPWADFIICGEGEYPFYRFMQVIAAKNPQFDTVPGLIYRQNGKIFVNSLVEPLDMNLIPFPYSVLDCEEDRVVYYESSRGCPFGCTYCLSATEKRVRALDLERTKADLGYFLYKKVMQVKFIDRTFNYDRTRAYEIFKYLIENDNGVTNFHFEICADLLDDETLRLLARARKGLFQMEIGIQSTNPETLAAIGRKENVYPVLYNTERLVALGNIHTHVDLIAGLPFETYELFRRSFNKVYALGADAFQLGFLKVLAGTPLAAEKEKYGIIHRDRAPYEVISTNYMSASDLARLKMIENMLDIFYNRGGFSETIAYLIEAIGRGAFGFYEMLADYYYDNGYQNRDRKKDDQYRILYAFAGFAAEQLGQTDPAPGHSGQTGPATGHSGQTDPAPGHPGKSGPTSDHLGQPDLAAIARQKLQSDAQHQMNPENLKRFLHRGWDLA